MRSGTTFLANFLNANEDCILLRDSMIAIFRLSPKLNIKTFIESIPIQAKNILLSNLKVEMSNLGFGSLATISSNQFDNLKELFNLALNLLSDSKTKIVGVKVTEAEDWLETIIQETDIRVIYLYRDLRDILLSSRNRFADYNRTTFSRKWKKGISKAFAINSSKIFFLKFEDLILNPRQKLEELSSFLGIKIKYDITQITDRSTNWNDNSSFHDLDKLFDPKSVFRWKKTISKETIYGSVVNRKLMKKLGYEKNNVAWYQFLSIKIIHFLPFPNKRQSLLKKLNNLNKTIGV